MSDVEERCLRHVEEAIELAQSCGVPRQVVDRVTNYVYGRPAGSPRQEVAGSLITLLAAAECLGVDALEAGQEELVRISEPEVVRKCRLKQEGKKAEGIIGGARAETVAYRVSYCPKCGNGVAKAAKDAENTPRLIKVQTGVTCPHCLKGTKP